MRYARYTAILLLALALLPAAQAQSRKRQSHNRVFDLQVRAGLNFCQIDGDASGNYNKLGGHAALNSSFPLGDGGWRFLVELGLTQKGARINNASLDRSISLLYVELPLMLAYDLMEGKLRLGAGVAPAILAHASVKTDGANDELQAQNYKRLDALPVCLSAALRLNQRLGLDLHWYNSLLNTVVENGTGTYRIWRSNKGQFNRLLQLGLTLNF